MKPITHFVQNESVDRLAAAFGCCLEGLSREHRIALSVALSTALLTGGSLEACLLDVEVLCDLLLPNELLAIAAGIDSEGCLEALLEAVVHQLRYAVSVAA